MARGPGQRRPQTCPGRSALVDSTCATLAMGTQAETPGTPVALPEVTRGPPWSPTTTNFGADDENCSTHDDAHRHVASCEEKPGGVDALFPEPRSKFEQHWIRRKERAVINELRKHGPAVRNALVQELNPILPGLDIRITSRLFLQAPAVAPGQQEADQGTAQVSGAGFVAPATCAVS